MESKGNPKKKRYLRWPWNVLVYILLVVLLRVFAIPFILLIMWWNKKQQPDGPEEGYCLQRTRGRLTGLIWAAIVLIGGGLAIWFFMTAQSMPYEAERLKEEMSFGYYLIPVAGVVAILVGLFLAYRNLRDVLVPEKSTLAQSIRAQLPYPDEAPPVKELFAMVDQDLKQNGQWCGKLGVGREWAASGCWEMRLPPSLASEVCSAGRSSILATPENAPRSPISTKSGSWMTAGSGRSPL